MNGAPNSRRLEGVAVAAELDGGSEEDGGQGEAGPEAGGGEEMGWGDLHGHRAHGHGSVEVGALGTMEAVFQEFEDVARVQGDDFEDTEGERRKSSPQEWGAAGPGGSRGRGDG